MPDKITNSNSDNSLTKLSAKVDQVKVEPLDKETEKLRSAVLKVLAKHKDQYPDEVVEVKRKFKLRNKKNNNNEAYAHKDVATLDLGEKQSFLQKLFHKKPTEVKIKFNSKLGDQIKNFNTLLLKKDENLKAVAEKVTETAPEPKPEEKKEELKAEKPKSAKEKKRKLFVFAKAELLIFVLNLSITVVLLGGIILAVVGISIYRNSFLSNTATSNIINVIPYPAGIVNHKVLTIAELRRDVAALNQYFSVQSEENDFFGNFPDDTSVQSMVWDKFVQDTLLNQIAEQYGLEVTDDMLQEQLDAIIEESGSQENFSNRIAALYGWNIDIFTQRVIKPFVLQEALAAKIFRDQNLRQKRIDLINEISNELRDSPEAFVEFIQDYSEDDLTRINDGETGLLPTNVLGESVRHTVTNLEVDEISGVIESGEGYEIIQLLGHTDKEVNIRRLLIRYPTLESLLDKAKERATIYRFVR